MSFSFEEIEGFIFDFDGVLTDNKVYVDEFGNESVVCSRSDGLAFDAIKKLGIPVLILSTEKNSVVSKRAEKLQVHCIHSEKNKTTALEGFLKKNNLTFDKVFYIGNDINDLHVMGLCGFSACPADSHDSIQAIAKFILKRNGGDGIFREVLENIFGLNLSCIIYKDE